MNVVHSLADHVVFWNSSPDSCAQGRCGRCPPGSSVMSDLFFFVNFFLVSSPAALSGTQPQ